MTSRSSCPMASRGKRKGEEGGDGAEEEEENEHPSSSSFGGFYQPCAGTSDSGRDEPASVCAFAASASSSSSGSASMFHSGATKHSPTIPPANPPPLDSNGLPELPSFEGDALLRSLTKIASAAFQRFFQDKAPHWNNLNECLDDVLELTGCEYGFIGKMVLGSATKQPALQILAITNIAWTPALKGLVLPNKLEWPMHRRGLLSETYRTGLPVYANDPTQHPSWRGLPTGHIDLRAFMSVPIFAGHRTGPGLATQAVPYGVFALANRPGGFDDHFTEIISHFSSMLGSLMLLYAHEKDPQSPTNEDDTSAVDSVREALSVISQYAIQDKEDFVVPKEEGEEDDEAGSASPQRKRRKRENEPSTSEPELASGSHTPKAAAPLLKQTQTVLRPEVFNSVIDTISDGVLVLDSTELKIVQCNKAAARMLGYTQKDLRTSGIRFPDLVLKEVVEDGKSDSETDAVDAVDWDAFLAKEGSAGSMDGLNIEASLIRKSKTPSPPSSPRREASPSASQSPPPQCIPVDLSLTSFLYTDKVFFSVVFRDVTQEKVFKKKDKLLAFLSHEIRNPLQVIMTGLQMVSDQLTEQLILAEREHGSKQQSKERENELDVPSRPVPGAGPVSAPTNHLVTLQTSLSPLLNMTQQSAEMLFGLMNDTIDFTRIDHQKFSPNVMEFDPASHIRMAVRQCDSIRSSLVSCTVDTSGLPKRVASDSRRMLQVLNNLLTNAFKYTNTGSVIVRATCERTPLKPHRANSSENAAKSILATFDHHLRIEVIDTGIGISSQDQEKLFSFSLFTQIESPQRRYSEKTGLGLAIAKHICTAMGGELSLKSRPGVGSTFSFTWPCNALDDNQEAQSEQEAEKREKESLEGLPILLVDDNPMVRRAVHNMLAKELVNCYQAEDGQQALDLLLGQDTPIQVVLMDCLMPVLDGYSAVRELRRRGISIPVIAVTGNSLSEDIQKCHDAGFSDVLVKPVSKQDILQRLIYWKEQYNAQGLGTISQTETSKPET